MKITPYRVLFERKLEPGKNTYAGYPTQKMEAIALREDGGKGGGYYEVRTHDWAGEDQYYLISFHIEDAAPYALEDITLHLDSTVSRRLDTPVNDLRYDADADLWYQRVTYDKNKKIRIGADCVTAAGVFRVVVKHRNKILEQYPQPWVYVLPNGISKDDYILMLSDLLRLHESVVCQTKSTVGIGTTTEREVKRAEDDAKLATHLIALTKQIMKLPAELLAKKYVKKPIRKIRRFDARTVREYIRKGADGKILSADYAADYDTYENRLIKCVLCSLRSRLMPEFEKSDIDLDVEEKVEYERKRLMEKRGAPPEPEQRKLSFCGTPSLNSNYAPLRISVDGNIVSMQGHNALADEGVRLNRLIFYASGKSELLFYLRKLIECYDRINRINKVWGPPPFYITCTIHICKMRTTMKKNTYRELSISDCVEINGDKFISEEISDDDYRKKLDEIIAGRAFIQIGANPFEETMPKHTTVSRLDNEIQQMENELRAELCQRKNLAIAYDELTRVHEELETLLREPWFENISAVSDVQDIRLTPKFAGNPLYSKVYELLIQSTERYPQILASFDVNAFGVKASHEVYEYWVFYKLLYELSSLGFNFDQDEQISDLIDHFRDFIEHRQGRKKYSGYVVRATHRNGENPIRIDIGYENTFTTSVGERLTRTPDCCLCVHHKDEREDKECLHWYFIDAKYNKYDEKKYFEEIYKTAVSKYIVEMEKILTTSPEYEAFKHEICGSYIAMASASDGDHPLSENGRLFGAKTSILDKFHSSEDETSKKDIDNSECGLPGHRYGAIMLTPAHDSELKTLLCMIFEYLESNKSDDADANPNLKMCWKCGGIVKRDEIKIGPEKAERYNTKYYCTCTNEKCRAFRVDNHCQSCGSLIVKHTTDNYHSWDDNVKHSEWAFLCPQCGEGVEQQADFPGAVSGGVTVHLSCIRSLDPDIIF